MSHFKEIKVTTKGGIEIFAKSKEDLFRNAAAGLYNFCLKNLPRNSDKELTIVKNADNIEKLLELFIKELYFRLETENEYFWEFTRLTIESINHQLNLTAKGFCSIMEKEKSINIKPVKNIYLQNNNIIKKVDEFQAKIFFIEAN